jgi:hypothetical protein
MTSDVDWDPSKFDNDITNLDAFHDPANDNHEEHHFDQHGEYCHHTVATHLTCVEEELYDACEFLDFDDQVDDLLDAINPEAVSATYGVHSSEVCKIDPKYELCRPLFVTIFRPKLLAK